jgi:hypothetical protein
MELGAPIPEVRRALFCALLPPIPGAFDSQAKLQGPLRVPYTQAGIYCRAIHKLILLFGLKKEQV